MSGHISISSWSIEVSLGNVADILKQDIPSEDLKQIFAETLSI